jgi:hypothetical protein
VRPRKGRESDYEEEEGRGYVRETPVELSDILEYHQQQREESPL